MVSLFMSIIGFNSQTFACVYTAEIVIGIQEDRTWGKSTPNFVFTTIIVKLFSHINDIHLMQIVLLPSWKRFSHYFNENSKIKWAKDVNASSIYIIICRNLKCILYFTSWIIPLTITLMLCFSDIIIIINIFKVQCPWESIGLYIIYKLYKLQ